MKPQTPKPTPDEKKFDRTKEEAFSNEGAPPPDQAGFAAADADHPGDDVRCAAAVAIGRVSAAGATATCGPVDNGAGSMPAMHARARDADDTQRNKAMAVVGVCSLLSARLTSGG